VFGALFGLPAETALTISPSRRVRELALGVPGLFVWQWVEGRRALRRGRHEVSKPRVCWLRRLAADLLNVFVGGARGCQKGRRRASKGVLAQKCIWRWNWATDDDPG
jgi:hypothetical protein